jgi:TonB-dependent receptor
VDPIDGDFDIFGFEDGSSRNEPGAVKAISRLFDSEAGDELSPNQERKLNYVASLMLLDDMDLVTESADPDFSLGANYGDVFYIGDAELGFFAAGNYSNAWSRQDDGIERTYLAGTEPGTVGDIADDFMTDEVANVIDLSGMLSIGMNIGDSSFESVTLISRNTESSVKTTRGKDGDSLNPTQFHTIIWEERQFVSQQFRGEHYFDSVIAEWQVTGSQAWRYAPDRREVRFNQNSENAPYVLNVADAGRRWDELEDNNLDGSFDLDWDLQLNDQWDTRLELGAQAIHRERETESATYGWLGNRFVVDVNSPNLQFSEVINLETITGDQATGFAFNEETLASDEYDAEMDLNSLYLSTENSYNNLVDVIIGVRYEDFQQVTDTFELAGAQDAVQSRLDQTETLPSLGVNWYYADGQQLRFAASQTVSRPDFKETSNAVFYDDEFSDVRVRGNPLLKISSIDNYDLRWEYYGEYEDTLKVALFYKDIENAIERVALTASGTAGNSRTFSNADAAELYGFEIDARKDFPLNEGYTQSVFVSGNAAIIESESRVFGQRTRKLQGQPDYTFNLILGWDDLEHNQEFTLLFNQNGESIRDVGISGQPDIIQEPRLSVNFNYSIELGANGTLQAKVNNLLDTDVEYTQGGEIFRQYGEGRNFSISYDWQF